MRKFMRIVFSVISIPIRQSLLVSDGHKSKPASPYQSMRHNDQRISDPRHSAYIISYAFLQQEVCSCTAGVFSKHCLIRFFSFIPTNVLFSASLDLYQYFCFDFKFPLCRPSSFSHILPDYCVENRDTVEFLSSLALGRKWEHTGLI